MWLVGNGCGVLSKVISRYSGHLVVYIPIQVVKQTKNSVVGYTSGLQFSLLLTG